MSDGGFFEKVGQSANLNRACDPQPARTVSGREAPDSDWARTVAAARCWSQTGDSFFPVSQVVEKVPPGAYRCRSSNIGPYIERMAIQTDTLLDLPDGAVEQVITEFRNFWKLQKNFQERGFTWKRGFLLWGPPGGGKTSCVWQMTRDIVKDHGGIVVFIEEPQLASICLAMIRRIEPERPIITVSEDVDAMIQRYGEHDLLALLDGETQISNVINVGTTNYPELLDRRFVDRPSRFDTIMYVDMPSPLARRKYLSAKEPSLTEEELDRWVKRSDGYSVAHLRELIIAVKCLEQPEDEAFERLDRMRGEKPVSTDGGGKKAFGFGQAARAA